MMRPKSWLPGVFNKPKNFHSLEHLKYLYAVLCKHNNVTESNRSLLVETMRSISEILIWGDQNDGTVFDFFLEKNMLSFFLSYIQQRYGRYICVQILQTLNILFENISNETSLYYLLSNNHINSIIVHKFDFSDEEVMAYFISFLKTLSFKLNKHTIHFFYNEHANDFALYTEAIKFFNHSESMVRIAVRTITLNVYKVGDTAMLRYIRDKTAAPYFYNLVWFIGVHVIDLDCCVRNDADHMSRDRLEDLVAEHLDHLHYVNDILSLNIDALNDILTDHLLNRLFIPLYVYSLSKFNTQLNMTERKHVSIDVALFLLSQVFLIIPHAPLVRQLADVIFHGDVDKTKFEHTDSFPRARVRSFTPPKETLAVALASYSQRVSTSSPVHTELSFQSKHTAETSAASTADLETAEDEACSQNITDEEKVTLQQRADDSSLQLLTRPFLSTIFSALDCTDNDYGTLFSLCLLYAMGNNQGINQSLMDTVSMPTDRSNNKLNYNVTLVERLIHILTVACQPGGKVRLATLELTVRLIKQLVYKDGTSYLQDHHLAAVEHARETTTQILRNFYKTEEIFLDILEDEFNEMKTRPLNVEYLMMDASILLTPTGTPLTGIDFNKRLPCGDTERSQRAIRVFLMIRDLSLTLLNETETCLPLSKDEKAVALNNVLDLNNSDLIACTVTTRDSRRPERRFLVIDCHQLILVEPDTKRLGWGVVRFVGLLQDVAVSGDKDDSRSLHVTIYKPSHSIHSHPSPLLSAKFIFDDHIRCMAAKQRLTKGRNKARGQKIQAVERLLDVLSGAASNHSQVQYTPAVPGAAIPGRSHPVRSRGMTRDGTTPSPRQQNSAMSSASSSPTHEHVATTSQDSSHRDYIINTCQIAENGSPRRAIEDIGVTKKVLPAEKYDEVMENSLRKSDEADISNHNTAKTTEDKGCNEGDRQVRHSVGIVDSKQSSSSDGVEKGECSNIKNDHLGKISLKTLKMHDTADEICDHNAVSRQTELVKKSRSHSQSPVRGTGHSSKERSKSLGGGKVLYKRDMTSTACQTTKTVFSQQPSRHPKTLQMAETPHLSLLSQSHEGPTRSQPKLMPPIEADRVRRVSDKSMKSQITELAQIVQKHYSYDK